MQILPEDDGPTSMILIAAPKRIGSRDEPRKTLEHCQRSLKSEGTTSAKNGNRDARSDSTNIGLSEQGISCLLSSWLSEVNSSL